jgi:hypothetical protein
MVLLQHSLLTPSSPTYLETESSDSHLTSIGWFAQVPNAGYADFHTQSALRCAIPSHEAASTLPCPVSMPLLIGALGRWLKTYIMCAFQLNLAEVGGEVPHFGTLSVPVSSFGIWHLKPFPSHHSLDPSLSLSHFKSLETSNHHGRQSSDRVVSR